MKWKREEAGVYQSGDWRIAGAGTHWTLFSGEEEVAEGRSKKELQQLAEDQAAGDAPKKKPKRPPGKKAPGKPVVEDLPKVVESARGPVELDSAFRSLGLAAESLTHSNNAVAAAIRFNAEKVEELTKAVQALVKAKVAKR